MPTTTPSIKVEAVAALGGEVVLEGMHLRRRQPRTRARSRRQQGLCFVHPFNDPDVIAGQGTIAVELERQWPRVPDAVFVPVGGGGLIGGIGAYIKQRYPGIEIIGVEPIESASMYESLRAGAPVTLERVGTFADGVAVRRVGDETLRARARGRSTRSSSSARTRSAPRSRTSSRTSASSSSPRARSAVAGMKRFVAARGRRGATLVADQQRREHELRPVAPRDRARGDRRASRGADRRRDPGAARRVPRVLRGARRAQHHGVQLSLCAGRRRARIFVGVSLAAGRGRGAPSSPRCSRPRLSGARPERQRAREAARAPHGRRPSAGARGRAGSIGSSFPSAPARCSRSCKAIGNRWNISLFHYRNHGSDYGRVLAGVQVPPSDRASSRSTSRSSVTRTGTRPTIPLIACSSTPTDAFVARRPRA